MLSTSVVVLDFETTGLSPRGGDRITEVAALRVRDGRVVDRYVTLVNAGVRIPSFITSLTGITNAMVATAPPAKRVIRELVDFLADDIVVAHNASFDHGFLTAEVACAGLRRREYRTLCTMRLARRLAPGLGSYKLAVLAEHLGVTYGGAAHRAEADAQVASDVLVKLATQVASEYSMAAVDPDLLRRVTRWSAREVPARLQRTLKPRVTRSRNFEKAPREDVRDVRPTPRKAPPTMTLAAAKVQPAKRPVAHNWQPRSYAGRRWRFDARGVLHDREYGFRYAPSAYTRTGPPGLGLIVDQPGVGSRIIDSREIDHFECARFRM